jgi:plastocyanin
MRRLGLFVLIAALVTAIAAATVIAATTNVTWKIGTNKTVKIKKGGTVKWIWGDGQPHDVKGPGFTSKIMTGKGKSYSHRFNKKGTFKIICQVHPTTMKTTVKVS